MLHRVGDDAIRGGLDRRIQALLGKGADPDRSRLLFGQCPDRRGEALVGENGREDAIGKRAQVPQRSAELAIRLLDASQERRVGL